MLDLTNAVVAEWEQIPAARLQNLGNQKHGACYGSVLMPVAHILLAMRCIFNQLDMNC